MQKCGAEVKKRLPMHEKPDICGPCGGRCCKAMPGSCTPDDFHRDMRVVEGALRTGRYAIDWWEGGDKIYYVRPATKGDEGDTFDPSWGGECTFLTETGCSLKGYERPENCRELEPIGGKCTSKIDKYGYALTWLEYQDQLEDIGRKVQGQAA
jgi:hypothetical protein